VSDIVERLRNPKTPTIYSQDSKAMRDAAREIETLRAERDQLILAIADHVTHRNELREQLAAGVAAEREACAKLCEERPDLNIATTYDWTRQVGQDLAQAIRERSNAQGNRTCAASCASSG
jgi:hypothetical protein